MDEIFPIDVEQTDGVIKTIDKDQAVRENATVDGMAVLNPAFKEGGAITA